MTPGSAADWIGGVHSPTDGRAEPALAGPAIAEGARAARRHDPSGLRRARARDGGRQGLGRRHREGHDPHAGRAAARAAPGRSLFCRRHGMRLPQASVRSTSFFTDARARGHRRRPVDARRHDPPPARRRLHGRPRRPRPARALAAGPDAMRASSGRPSRSAAGVSPSRIGRSFFDGPEAMPRWRFDGVSPFERHAHARSAAPTRSWCSLA